VALIFLLFLLLLGGFGLSMHSSTSDLESTQVAKVMAAAKLNGVHGAGALAGARLFAESGCTNCHTYGEVGSSNLGAPDLTAEGTKGHTVSWLVAKLRCPSCVTRDSPMPTFTALGAANLQKVALFLAASRAGP
jgi:cbb3-type cytochrome oxidase cytochrome c subunit